MIKIIFAPIFWVTSLFILYGFAKSSICYFKYSMEFPFEIPFKSMSKENKKIFLKGLRKIIIGVILLVCESYIYDKLK